MAGGAYTVGGAIPLPGDLPLSVPLAEPLGVDPGEFLEEPLGGPGLRGGQSEGNVFAFKYTFISTFTFMIRTTAGTISGRGGGSHGSGAVRKLGHVSRGST